MHEIIKYLNITQLLVVATFVSAFLFLPKSRDNIILKVILSICLSNEIITLFFVTYNVNNAMLMTINIILHHSFWLLLLSKNIAIKRVIFIVPTYIALSIASVLLSGSYTKFNYNAFIAGALLYIAVFIYACFRELKRENFAFYYSNTFLLLTAPVLFFLGLSFIFGFRSHALAVTPVIMDIHLYAMIGFVVNLIYYALLNGYIYSENKLKNG